MVVLKNNVDNNFFYVSDNLTPLNVIQYNDNVHKNNEFDANFD